MRIIWALPLALLVTIVLLSGCSSASSATFHYTGDGELLMLQPDDVPPGWELDHSDNIPDVRNAKQWRKLYRVPSSAKLSVHTLYQRVLTSGLSVFDAEQDAIIYWQDFSAGLEGRSDEACLSESVDQDYSSDIADQYTVWCSLSYDTELGKRYEQTVMARYGNVITYFSADVTLNEEMTADEAAELGVLHWQDAKRLIELLDERVDQAIDQQ